MADSVIAVKMPIYMRGVANRAGWPLLDQALASAGNFLVTVAIARESPSNTFGLIALGLGAYFISVNVVRAFASTPLFIRYEARDVSGRVGQAALSCGFLVATPLAMATAAVGLAIRQPTLVGLGVVALPLLLQDCIRYILLASRKPKAAVLNDSLDLFVTAASLGTVWAFHWDTRAILGGWGLAAVVSLVYGLRQLGILNGRGTRIGVRQAAAYLKTHRDLSPNLLVEMAARSATLHVVAFLIAANVGLNAVAGFRAAGQIILGPLNMVLMGLLPQIQLVVGEHYRRNTVPPLGKLAAVIGSSFVGTGILLAFLLPDDVGIALTGESWAYCQHYIIPTAAFLAGGAISSVYVAKLRLVMLPSQVRNIRLLTSCIVVASVAVVLPHGGTPGLRGVLIALAVVNTALFALLARGDHSASRVAGANTQKVVDQ